MAIFMQVKAVENMGTGLSIGHQIPHGGPLNMTIHDNPLLLVLKAGDFSEDAFFSSVFRILK